ncbi:acyl-CoA dehydrogenase family protein [Acrocarpospora macrocephala]|uniref:Medium-chain specific acyl-CoA dehydrogenase, mitochondrial n=1 Tax=Acrocarpospora macrocephala TaxID=150177 RepID=A0A5M3WQY9_9ACTN|nr:acyl-CoA dehydrogenase family protein [Acrocarpospora macrocephala]GES11010.1 butyryl-CoA dehydrogenase [Acrocarpospora macrocephala]
MSLVRLTAEQVELRERAKAFVDDVLIPREEAAERAGGRLPEQDVQEIMKAAVAARLNGGRHAPEHGGQGWSAVDYVVVHEQLGRNTNGLWWWVPDAYNVLAAGTPEQIDRYLRPALKGDAWISYAVTEEHAGSDPSGIATTAVQDGDEWVLNGEKWFVTSGDVAAAHIVVAVVEGHGPTLFIVDADAEGVEFVDEPLFTHTFPHGHPTVRLTDVRVPGDAVLGGLGQADALQQSWFVEERLGIAVHCVAAMGRLLEEAVAWAGTREQGGARLIDHQGVAFPLADSAADATAARLLVHEVAALADSGADRKIVHAKASVAKLFASEAAYRCADRAVQTFGGRGYIRTNVAERFLRELRVDRIWEGTSEIQRLIISRSLERRGVRQVIA